MKHPAHPLFVHFPIAFWVSASLCDLGGYVYPPVWLFGSGCLLAGCLSAPLAIGSGLMQLAVLKPAAQVQKLINLHIVVVSTSYGLYLGSLALRMEQGQLHPPEIFAVVLSFIALLFLGVAGWLGGKLVYEHGLGVQNQARK